MTFSRNVQDESVRLTEYRVMTILAMNATPELIHEKTGISIRHVHNVLDNLVARHYAEKIAPGIYGLTADGRAELLLRAKAIPQDQRITEVNTQLHVSPAGSYFPVNGFVPGQKEKFAELAEKRDALGYEMAKCTSGGFVAIENYMKRKI